MVTSFDAHWCLGTPDLGSLKSHRYQLIFDYVVGLADIHVRLDALALNRGRSNRLDCPYVPVRFFPFEKFSTNDKLLLAFDAFAFSQALGKRPQAGRIIYGRNHAVANIPLSALLRTIQRIIRAIDDQQTHSSQPPVALNKHCVEC